MQGGIIEVGGAKFWYDELVSLFLGTGRPILHCIDCQLSLRAHILERERESSSTGLFARQCLSSCCKDVRQINK